MPLAAAFFRAVRVRVRGEADDVVLAVHNQGNPIPSKALPHLFAPMQRGSERYRAVGSEDLGLGLFIVNQIVLAHGGSLSVDSTPEQGTTFEVRLPRHASRSSGKNGP